MKIKLHNISKPSPSIKIFSDFKKNPPAFSFLPKDFREIEKFAKTNRKWSHVLVIGIGGSSLPAQALINALAKLNPRVHSGEPPEPHFLDNLDAKKTINIFEKLDWEKTLVIVIAKSGETLETLANFFVVKQKLGTNWRKQTVAITDPKKGFLRELATKEKLTTFDIPPEIGGRFSIFTSVGLLPAALAGINLRKLIKGANKASPKKAFEFAQIQAREFKRGKNINTFCIYSNALESFAKWHEQLLAESIGKNAKVGITPQIAIGATDQHSKLQLWSDGPNDKFFTFLKVKKVEADLKIPNPPKEFGFLKNKSMQQILNAEFDATVKALAEKKRSLAIFEIEKLDEESLGEMLQFWMLEIYFLGKLLGVDPFDQPGVERGKFLTRKALGGN